LATGGDRSEDAAGRVGIVSEVVAEVVPSAYLTQKRIAVLGGRFTMPTSEE
jgi:hypothetical protein